MADQDVAYNRLRWTCSHRAMREMDVILGGFLEKHYLALSPQQAEAFTRLANMEDIELWPLVTGKKASDDPGQAEILAMLRDVRVK